MSYGYIARGPMAADAFEAHFTRIANQLFRDARLSFKAKGIFGLVSTHKDGYGLSMESIAASSTDGISAVRTGLKELERFGYLMRQRDRNEAGHLGQTRYWITDMPDGLVIVLSPRPPDPRMNSPGQHQDAETARRTRTPKRPAQGLDAIVHTWAAHPRKITRVRRPTSRRSTLSPLRTRRRTGERTRLRR